MKGLIKLSIVLIILLLSPILTIWCLNSLAEAGGSDFYIEHTVWNYWVAFVSALVLKGSSS